VSHNVVSIGVDPTDGTIQLAYDMHSQTLKYRTSIPGVAVANPAVAWSPALFTPETNQLSGVTVNSVTYPQFIRTNTGATQLIYRVGVSGNGAWVVRNYNPVTHSYDAGYQFDTGSGTYAALGTTQRNEYPNGFTYGSNGRLYDTFVWREGGGSANGTNHDINFVYSDDGGKTWKNNAGAIVASQSAGTQFSVNSPGLVVRPLSQYTSLMNQQSQNVDSTGKIHTFMWYQDTAKTAGPLNTFTVSASSYFHMWRDNLGNWHRSELPGAVPPQTLWGRARLYFDATDNAIAIYNDGDHLNIATASKANNWTDWTINYTGPAGYASDADADQQLLLQNGVLSIFQQKTPSTNYAATEVHTMDFTVTNLAPTISTFSAVSGDWNADANWTAPGVPGASHYAVIDSGRTANLAATPASPLGNCLAIGTASGNGTLNISGGTLAVAQTIIVGRDGNAVGTYNQTGGSVSSWRFTVGDYYNETSGGGVSSAVVSGGTLTVAGDLMIATSDTAGSSGSSFTVAGTGQVAINGEVTLADDGNTGILNINGGTMTIAGDLYRGYNQVNTAILNINGGTLDMTGNAITVDTLALNSGRLQNVGIINSGATLSKDNPGTMSFAGTNTITNNFTINAGALRAESTQAFGSGALTVTGGANTGRIEMTNSISLNNAFTLAGRPDNSAPHLLNVSGNNTFSGTLSTASGGPQYTVQSDAGKLTVTGNFVNAQSGTPGDVRTLNLQGAGNGEFQGAIADNTSASNPSITALTKSGGGTWILSGSNTFSGPTTITGGTLRLGTPTANTGIVAHYTFDNTFTPVGGTVDHTGVAPAGGTLPTFGADRFGNPNSAASFSGSTTQYVAVPYASDLALNSFTISAWVSIFSKPPGTTIYNAAYGILSTRQSGNDNTFDVKIMGTYPSNHTLDNAIHGDLGTGTAWISNNVDILAAQGGNIPGDSSWHMITYAIDAANHAVRMYVDGTLDNSLSYTGTPLLMKSGQTLKIGYDFTTSTQAFQGLMDDVYIVNRALSTADVQNLYYFNTFVPVSGAPGTLPVATTLNISAGGTLDLNGNQQTVASLSGDAGSAILLGAGQLIAGGNSTSSFSGSISGSGGFTKNGAGSLTFSGSNSYTGTTLVNAGTLQLAATFSASGLVQINSGATVRVAGASSVLTSPVLIALSAGIWQGRLDLANGSLVVTTADASDKTAKLATLASQISTGSQNNWTGNGITSTTVAADPTHKTLVTVDNALLGLTTFNGVPVTASSLLVEATWLGDSNLDRKVDVTDLGTLATHYGQSVSTGVLAGDFNGDGKVDVTDLGLLATNYGAGTAGSPFAVQSVPEPATLAAFIAASFVLLKRRRRSA
jgi:autotransporter-associated beta strand protein